MQRIGILGIIIVFVVSTHAVVFGNHHIDTPLLQNKLDEVVGGEVIITHIERRVFNESFIETTVFGGTQKVFRVKSNIWNQYTIREVNE